MVFVVRRYVNLKMEDDDLRYLDDIAKNESRSRRKVMTLILERTISKKRLKKDLTSEVEK